MAAVGMMCATSAFAVSPDHTVGPFGSGKVTFTGTITNSPCDIQAGDEDMTVKFGQVSYRKLKADGAADTDNIQPVTIHLQNCSFDPNQNSETKATKPYLMSMVSVSFSGSTASGDKAYANTSAPGMAKGVGVQLMDSSMAVLTPSVLASKGTDPQQLKNGNNEINLFAQLINLGSDDTVTTGAINIPLNYTLTYN